MTKSSRSSASTTSSTLSSSTQSAELPTIPAIPQAKLDVFRGANDALVQEIAEMTLSNHGQYTHAALRRKNINAEIKQINELRFSITRPIDEAKSVVMAMFKPSIEIREAAVEALDKKLTGYVDAQKQATEAARETASSTLAKEQSKQLTLAEQALVRAKQQREAADKLRNQAANEEEPGEQNRLLEAAEHLEALADQNEQRAERRQETAESIDPNAVNVNEPNLDVDGVQLKYPWKARITNLDAVLRQIADHKIDLSEKTRLKLAAALQGELGDLARALKKNNIFEGLEFYQDSQVASTRT